jgi:hypothetical protein
MASAFLQCFTGPVSLHSIEQCSFDHVVDIIMMIIFTDDL